MEVTHCRQDIKQHKENKNKPELHTTNQELYLSFHTSNPVIHSISKNVTLESERSFKGRNYKIINRDLIPKSMRCKIVNI